ncbi:MAG: right-handed parallel beta-helix repeat-containing protein, partial [Bacteroidales bacterium]|nr:right-handed parallel beta-helix repeat-containing protein [Bacteroidales bacterium]
MKRIFLYLALMFVAVAPLKAQIEVQIGNTTSSDNGNFFPTQTYYNYSYTQQIYYQSEIGGAMSIDKIAFQFFYTTSSTRNLDIYMGNVNKATFNNSSDFVSLSAMTKVFSGNVAFNNIGNNYWYEIELNTPFTYDGVNNLVIAVDDNTGSYDNSSRKFYTNYVSGTACGIYRYGDGSNINPSSPTSAGSYYATSAYRNNIKLISSCTCCPPSVTVSDVTANSATLTWSVDEGNTVTIEYRRLGEENYTAISGNGTYAFENLIPATTYEVRAKTTCPDEVSDYKTIEFTTTSVLLETIYVSSASTGDGSSWTSALGDIPSALNLAQQIYHDHDIYPEIWVAEGTYTGDTEAENAFVFPAGTKLYGGFAGNETLLEDRNPSAHETVLSGNNTQRVIYHDNYFYDDQIIVVDGFTIANGKVEGEYDEGFGGGVLIYNSGMNLRNCVIRDNTATRGGGLYLSNYDTPVVNCKIYGNTAEEGGGVAMSEGYLYNSLIYNNTATENAGGVFYQYGRIFNCDIVNNICASATGFGGISGENYAYDKGDRGVYDYNILNCVVWGNKADGVSSQVNDNDYNTRLAYSAVEGGCTGMAILNLASANVGRGASYPKFTDPTNNDFTLQNGSMMIGRGYYAIREMPNYFPMTDLAGNDRVRHDDIDIGAYESDFEKTSSIVASEDGVIFVKTDGTGDGSSWANATSDLELALNESVYFTTKPDIWVAAGTYYGNFVMTEGVDVIGGFNGTETSARMANPETNVTILDGQNNGRVLTQSEYFETSTTWSGFTIQHGKFAQGNGAGVYLEGNAELRDCKIINNVIVNESEYEEYRGVGLYMDGGIVTNCLIKNNIGTGLIDGGGLFVSYGEVMNCRIEGNQAAYGGGCYNNDGTMINCIIVNNTATGNGGGTNDGSYINCTIADNSVSNDSGTGGAYYGYYTNCIIWGNSNTQGLGNYGSINATYSCVEGGCSGEGNIALASENTGSGLVPKFVDPENGDWNLQEGSACINRGTNDARTLPDTDIAGNQRIQKDIVDCGAYETPYDKAAFIVPGEGNIVYVKAGGSGNGSSWANAIGDLKFALADCASMNPVPTIWVAEMTIDGPVKMQPGVNVYGGFAGTETSLEERNLAEHHTIIDGYNNVRCLYQENAFTAETRVVWDGFVIQNGYKYGGDGAGVYILGYADLANCEIKNCGAYISSSYYRVYGGGVYASNSTLTSCYIHNNYSQNSYSYSYGCGGGICANSGAVMINCIIANNTSSGQGSGVYFYSTGNEMINCDVVNCYSQTSSYYAVYSYGGDANYVYNTVIWGNKGNGNNVSAAGGSYSHCASDVELTGTANILIDTDNNSGTGPLFTTPSSDVGSSCSCDDANWMPKDGSALINMGDNGVEGLPAKDFAGNDRVQYSKVDVGAYETPYNVVMITPSADGIIYVKQEASGTEDGSSWENATSNFAKALAVAAACETRTSVWVAEGTYDGPFTIKARTDVYGGFAGTEASLQERNWREHLTILHGDGTSTTLVQPGDFDNESDAAAWDGFVIENGGGSGNGGGARLLKNSTLRNSIVRNNTNTYQGAAVYMNYARMENCEIYGNTLTGNNGGVVYMYYYSTAINCKVYNNTAVYASGFRVYYGNTLQNCLIANNEAEALTGLYIYNGNNTVTGCTIVRNKATSSNAGLYTTYSSNVITNTVSWGNMKNGVEDDINSGYSGNISYCAFTTEVQGTDNVLLEASNLGGMGPKFVNPTAQAGASDVMGDYSLQQGSYLINKGNASASYWNPDLAGNERVQQGGIDLGAFESPYAYESPIVPNANNIIFVKAGGTGNGSSWENATSSLQLALNEAVMMQDKPEVWVKGDTFIGSFKMKEGVDVYGGFAGNETSLQERDLTLHSTILDGNAAGRVLLQETDFTETTVWDGFTIQNGKFSEVDEVGPAAYLMANSVLRNCEIKNNTAIPKYNYYGVKGGFVMAKGATLENCKIHGNSLTASKNCQFIYPAVNLENGVLKNCEVYDNVVNNTYATTWGEAAGVYATGSIIESCIIRNNTASGYNAGVRFYGTAESIMVNCLVANNTAYAYAGVYLESGVNNVSIINCDMVGNKNTGSSSGAGLYTGTSSTNNKLINSVVWGNKYNSSNSNL